MENVGKLIKPREAKLQNYWQCCTGNLILRKNRINSTLTHSLVTSHTVTASCYRPSINLSLAMTDSSNFMTNAVPLCQCAVTFAGCKHQIHIVYTTSQFHTT